jgi:hypothetical protein
VSSGRGIFELPMRIYSEIDGMNAARGCPGMVGSIDCMHWR